MNLGLGNLIELKRQLLAAGLVAEDTYDSLITGIGKGVAGMFDQYCNRGLERVAGETDEFSGDRRMWVLSRYPVETVSGVEVRDDMTAGWVAQTVNGVIQQRDDGAGVIWFGEVQGNHLTRLKVTFTGGYWFDTTEDGSGVMPAGATLLPKDVSLAWYLQCREVWLKIDRLGLSLIQGEGEKNFVSQMLAGLELVPMVKEILGKHVRYQLT